MSHPMMCTTTMPNMESAKKMANELVENRFAACFQSGRASVVRSGGIFACCWRWQECRSVILSFFSCSKQGDLWAICIRMARNLLYSP